ncbi:MAG: SIMPL domain-containing protein [Oceanococcus sp.]
MHYRFRWALLAVSLLAVGPVWAEQQARRQIQIQGQASRMVTPDQAALQLTVEARAKQAGDAMNAAGSQAQAVVDTLAAFVDKNQIRALQTQVREVVKGTQRSWRRDSGEPVEMLASRQIQLQRLAIEKLPDVMRALAQHPLARVDNVTPSVSNAAEVEDDILMLAIDDGKARALRIAKRLGVNLGLPIAVNVQQHYAPQAKMAMRVMAIEADAGGGYEATGENEIRAQVSISFELEAP